MLDISLHILDIIENAVRAQATKITINIEINIPQNELRISIEDNGSGMDTETLKGAGDPFFTTKTQRKKSIGLGISLFRQNAEQCEGSFSIKSTPGKGTNIIATFKYDHIDRMPLGNLKDTLLGSIVGHENTDFNIELKHIRSDSAIKAFIFNTASMRAELGDIPLSYPDVIRFIDKELESGITTTDLKEY